MKIKLIDFKALQDFPSGSGIEYYDKQLYLVGDDAKEILVLTRRWKEVQRIILFEHDEVRIPKATKSDLEASTIIQNKGLSSLLLLGSGSFGQERNAAFLFNFESGKIEEFNLGIFYERLKNSGIKELNIEASAMVEDHLVFGNRGNAGYPHNFFIVTDHNFWLDQENAELQVFPLELPTGKDDFAGISGFSYSPKFDRLMFTASTEATQNVYDDGNIGDSYLGLIENISRKIGRKKIKVNDILNLTEAEPKFKGYKIESLCVQSEKETKMKLHLIADNDSGTTYLFKARLRL